LPGPLLWHLEGPTIPEPLIRTDAFHHAGQGRLDGEGNENLPVELFRPTLLARPDGVVPQAVEVQPVMSLHLRPRVLGMDAVWVNVLRPARQQRSLRRLPVS